MGDNTPAGGGRDDTAGALDMGVPHSRQKRMLALFDAWQRVHTTIGSS